MAKSYTITALDIGSGFIKALSVFKKPGEDNFEILGQIQAVSSGIRRGVVIDNVKVSVIISELIKKLGQKCNKRINGVYASVGGGHIFSTFSRGLVSVSRADRKISEEDVSRVLQAAQTFPISLNKEVLEVFPKEFIVDGESGIREVVGMEGVRLETDALLLCGFSPYLKKSSQVVFDSGLELNYLIPDLIASSRAVLTAREKELGVCVLDIGAGTSSMSVYEEGNLIYGAVFPIGSGHITNDIAVCLKTDIDTAERIKIEFGTCKNLTSLNKKTDKKIKINLNNSETETEAERIKESLEFSKKILADIIEARVSEIFDVANKELKKISRFGQLPAGVVLTGGGAKIPGIRGLAKKEMKLPCRIGAPSGFSPFNEDPGLSTLCGLILEGIDLEEEGHNSGSRGGIFSSFKKFFKLFIP